MGREPTVRPKRGRYPCGVCSKGVGANLIWCQCCQRWSHQRCSGLRNLKRAGDNFRCTIRVRLIVVVPQRLEVEEDLESLEIVDSFCYLGDVISCGGGVDSAGRPGIKKWKET